MEPERWQEIKRICQSALDIEREKRKAYLQQACAGDDALRKEVESLLAQQHLAQDFMKDPAVVVAAQAVVNDPTHSLSMDLIGRSVARYRVAKKIGEGGMGEVFLAEDTSLRCQARLPTRKS